MWLWNISMWWAHVESWHTLGLWLLLFSHKNSQEPPQGLWTWDLTRDVAIWMKMVWNVHLLSTPGIIYISTSIYKAFQSYDPKSSKSWPWLSNVVLKPAVEACEILHHQKDGWNPNKIMGCLASINCRISQPSEASATPSNRRFLGRGSGEIDGTSQTSHGKLGNFWTKNEMKMEVYTLW